MSRAQKMRKIITRDYNTESGERRRQGPLRDSLLSLSVSLAGLDARRRGRMQESRVATKRPPEFERLNEFLGYMGPHPHMNYSPPNLRSNGVQAAF
jgi:hypothetical protein